MSVVHVTFYFETICFFFTFEKGKIKISNVSLLYCHCHHHSSFTHYMLIYKSIIKKVIKKCYSRNFKIHGIKKTEKICSLGQPFLFLMVYRISSFKGRGVYLILGRSGAAFKRGKRYFTNSRAYELFIMVTVTWSNGRGRPKSNRNFWCLSRPLMK